MSRPALEAALEATAALVAEAASGELTPARLQTALEQRGALLAELRSPPGEGEIALVARITRHDEALQRWCTARRRQLRDANARARRRSGFASASPSPRLVSESA